MEEVVELWVEVGKLFEGVGVVVVELGWGGE